MKVCLISVEYPPTWGGSGVYGYELANHLKKLGHEVFVITRRLPGTKAREIIDGIKIFRINWIPVPMFYIPFFSILSFKFVLKLHKKEKFDIIHGNYNCDWFYKKEYFKVPLISTMHGTWIGEYLSLLNQPLKYHGYNDIFIRIIGKYFGRMEKKVAKRTDKEIVVSNYSKREVISYYKINPVKIKVIPNGVDTQIFNIDKRDKEFRKIINPNNGPLLLYVGRLVARKGPQILVDSIAIVKKKIPDIKLLMIGAGPLKNLILKRIEKLHLENNIKILSNLSIEELAKMYANSDIFILHSYYEAQGIVLLEAMASGLPIIATRVGGIPETVPDNECGRLVPPGDALALGNEIINLIQNEDLKKQFGENGIKRIEKLYTWEYLAKKIENLYLRLIEKK